MNEFWLKQSSDKPLFENMLWSKPENKSRAGKLLIIGGNLHGFSAPASEYSLASKAGAGVIKVLLPESLRESVGTHLEDAIYCPSNKSGSFSRSSLAEFLDHASWSDLTLLAGDFGHNSETTILIEDFIKEYHGPLCLSGDAIDAFLSNPNTLLERPDTLIVADFNSLQKIIIKARITKAMTSSMALIQLVELLKDITSKFATGLITYHNKHFIVAAKGKVSTTEVKTDLNNWQLTLAPYSSVWWMQNKSQIFEATSTAIYDIQN